MGQDLPFKEEQDGCLAHRCVQAGVRLGIVTKWVFIWDISVLLKYQHTMCS
jgi:hypothetical protein